MSDRQVKCVIWDLDDTLWEGSLAENDEIIPRPHIIDLIRRLDEKGVVNSVCSKNSYATAEKSLRNLGIWDYFVFPVIDFVPKGQVVTNIIKSLQLRPDNVVFVDDNSGNRHEVAHYSKNILTLDPNATEFQPIMAQILENNNGTSRLADYKMLERKHADSESYSDNTEFLAASNITMCILRNPADMMFRERILDLANRSHQLNFTKSKFVDFNELDTYLTGEDSVHVHHGTVWVYDKYGVYGLVGFYAFNESARRPQLDHFYFSCRVLNMGVEQALYGFLREEYKIGRFAPLETGKEGSRSYIRIIREFDDTLRSYIENESFRPACYTTSVIAGCASGIVDHYLHDHMRPAWFALNTLAMDNKLLPKTDYVIYTVYSDYVNAPWSESGGFSYRRFQDNLVTFLRKHHDRKMYLLLASEKNFLARSRISLLNITTQLKRFRSFVMDGKSNRRFRRCNCLVRAAATMYSNVALIETEDFVSAAAEQHDPTHFDRIVIKRICDYIGRLEVAATSPNTEMCPHGAAAVGNQACVVRYRNPPSQLAQNSDHDTPVASL